MLTLHSVDAGQYWAIGNRAKSLSTAWRWNVTAVSSVEQVSSVKSTATGISVGGGVATVGDAEGAALVVGMADTVGDAEGEKSSTSGTTSSTSHRSQSAWSSTKRSAKSMEWSWAILSYMDASQLDAVMQDGKFSTANCTKVSVSLVPSFAKQSSEKEETM